VTTKHFSPEHLNERRRQAVRLRLDGHTVASVARQTGLSAPTVSAAWKAFRKGGWEAIDVKPRGRRKGQTEVLGDTERQRLKQYLAEWPADGAPGWTSRALSNAMPTHLPDTAVTPSPRAIEHWLESQGLKVPAENLQGLEKKRSAAGRWFSHQVQPVWEVVDRAGGERWQGGIRVVPGTDELPHCYQLYLHGKRGALYTRCLPAPPQAEDYLALFQRLLRQNPGTPVALIFHGAYFAATPEIGRWLNEHPEFHLINRPAHEDQ
jgi:transposase